MRWRAGLAAAALALALAPAPSTLAQRASTAVTEIRVAELPPEARQTIALIRKGGPFPYAKDGALFGNREGALPKQRRGYYREYTVKTPGMRARGAKRIIWGAGGEFYYTEDHYSHFQRIRE